jgi:hypothetical protein
MRPSLILTAFVALLLCFGTCSAAYAECLPSAKAVWAVHPGSHATWRLRLPGHEGVKCWFAKGSTNLATPRVKDRVVDSQRGTVHREVDRRTDGQAKRAGRQTQASAADGLGQRPTRLESQDTSASTERGPLSILIWGRPMLIDATWEELFAGREHRAK